MILNDGDKCQTCRVCLKDHGTRIGIAHLHRPMNKHKFKFVSSKKGFLGRILKFECVYCHGTFEISRTRFQGNVWIAAQRIQKAMAAFPSAHDVAESRVRTKDG